MIAPAECGCGSDASLWRMKTLDPGRGGVHLLFTSASHFRQTRQADRSQAIEDSAHNSQYIAGEMCTDTLTHTNQLRRPC